MLCPRQLNNGRDMPVIGFGTFGGSDGPKEVYEASKVALELGYRHFDTAYVCTCVYVYVYYNTREIADKLNAQTRPRKLSEKPFVKALFRGMSCLSPPSYSRLSTAQNM